jgi:pimeloyl-ACP methyl ester carboxylesterase
MRFSTYTPAALKNAPLTQMVGEYKVEFLAYESVGNMDKTPVMFLGGAFQSFASFRNEVEQILEHCPVILADFPSQGGNDQLAPELNMEDYADLIAGFLTAQGVPTVQLMGVSYGSAMATLFASAYPDMIDRLLISGITCFRRESLITLLEDSLTLLDAGDMDSFATTAVCNLINHNRMEDTKIGATYRRLLFRQIARLNDNERQRYAQNTRRLLRFQGFKGFPTCETLIATGEFDNFTLPQENAAVARQCAKGTFAVIRNADHLAQFEQKSASMEVVCRFMTGQSLEGINGVDVYDPQAFDFANQRLQGRFRPMEQPYTLTDEATGKTHTVRIENINFSGCELEQINADMTLTDASDQLYLEIPETGHRYHVRMLVKDKKTMRCLILQRDMKGAEALLSYLQDHLLMIRENQPSMEEVAGKLA